MSLFRRNKSTPDPPGATTEFWRWWTAEGADAVAAAIAAHTPHTIVDELSRRIAGVDPKLAWELGPGQSGSQHELVVTAEGDPALRAVTRRWLRAAPAADATWSFADLRRPAASIDDLQIHVGAHAVDLREVSVGTEVDGSRIDVTVFHPIFPELPQEARGQITFIALDSCLGERAVEIWIGAVDISPTPLADSIPLAQLAQVVADHEAAHTAEDGGPIWGLLRGVGPRGPVMASAQVPLNPMVAPELDQYVRVQVPFRDATSEGFPGSGSLTALRDLEDHVVQRLGTSGRIVAHESSAGQRTFHIYVDSTGPGADVVAAAVDSWDQGRAQVSAEPDPRWEMVRHLAR